jgi:hypothetical protein
MVVVVAAAAAAVVVAVIVVTFWEKIDLSTDPFYVQLVGHELKVYHRRNFCSCWLVNNITYTVDKGKR